jgi:hypothetical protein
VCGAPVDIAGIDDLIGKKLAGGDPNPAALARPSSGGRSGAGRRTGRAASGTGTKSGGVARRRKPASPRQGESSGHTAPGPEDPAAQGG